MTSILIIGFFQIEPEDGDEIYFFQVSEAIFVGWFTLEYITRFLIAPKKVQKNMISF